MSAEETLEGQHYYAKPNATRLYYSPSWAGEDTKPFIIILVNTFTAMLLGELRSLSRRLQAV